MYIKGDVNIGRVTDYSNIDYKDFDNAAYLPHSCDKLGDRWPCRDPNAY